MASTGCSPQQVWSDWDIPSIVAQTKYWRKHPPVHVLVALYLDYKAPPEAVPGEVPPAIADMQQNLPALPEHLKLKPTWLTPRKPVNTP